MRYTIASNSLEQPKTYTVEPNKYYWLGASDSPTFIKVTRATADRFWYVEHYALRRNEAKEVQIERWIGEDLIARATATMRRNIEIWMSDPHNAGVVFSRNLRILDTHDLSEEEKQDIDNEQAEHELRAMSHATHERRIQWGYMIEDARRWQRARYANDYWFERDTNDYDGEAKRYSPIGEIYTCELPPNNCAVCGREVFIHPVHEYGRVYHTDCWRKRVQRDREIRANVIR